MIAFTDGSCLKNGSNDNEGGYGIVFLEDNGDFITCYQSRSKNTTNNREELKAILNVFLQFGKMRPAPTIYSDSAYCVNSLTQWIYNWANNNWIKSDGDPPENLDIMKAFYEYYQKGYQMNLLKVSGHAGLIWNELADKLATNKITVKEAIKQYRKEI